MPKAAQTGLPKQILEQIYAEVEARVTRKFEGRIKQLENKCAALEQERDAWRKRYFKEQEVSRHLQGQLELAQAKIKGLEQLAERQKARIDQLEKQLHGRTSEVSIPDPEQPKPKRSRGKAQGAQGFGRKKRDSLEPVDCIHDFEPGERNCPKCGLPYKDMGEKVTERIHVEYKVIRVIHRRKKIRKTCKCHETPTVKTAPGPDQLFKASLFSIETWSHVIYDKYHLQRPTNRTLEWFESFGLDVPQGTFTNGFKRLHANQVFKPLIQEITARVKASKLQQKDETGWKVFQEMDGKKGYAWWLWVTRVKDCCLFEIDPNRSRKVAKRTIGDDPVVLVTDCLSTYHNMGDNVTNAWCWAHIRRALLELASFHGLKNMSEAWVSKVDQLYHLNHLRLGATEEMYSVHDAQLQKAIVEFERQAKRNAKRSGMHYKARKIFRRIAQHWDGLTVFVRMPAVPMDNNNSEQALRNAVVGRKNYYGSGAHWSAQFAADLFTIFETLKMNGINRRTWLTEYLYAVARSHCKAPPNATAFLPWNSPPLEHLHA
jgi:transposase